MRQTWGGSVHTPGTETTTDYLYHTQRSPHTPFTPPSPVSRPLSGLCTGEEHLCNHNTGLISNQQGLGQLADSPHTANVKQGEGRRGEGRGGEGRGGGEEGRIEEERRRGEGRGGEERERRRKKRRG